MNEYYEGYHAPEDKKVTCQVCYLADHTGFYASHDLDDDYHEGFTIGRGKVMYWMIWWHKTGNCTVYKKDCDGGLEPRWLPGDTMITIHFK